MTMRFHVERQISAPAEQVWELLTDASSYADWNPAVSSIQGPIAEGEKVALVSVVNPKRTFKLKVSEMSAPNRMVWSDGMPLGLFTGPLAGIITKTIPDMSQSFEQFADGLKKAAESQTSDDPVPISRRHRSRVSASELTNEQSFCKVV